MATADRITEVRDLKLDDPANYTAYAEEDWPRWSPAEADRHAATDPDLYRRYTDHSCDLTMRGGTTSGVIYPLAACSLAQHYTFRSVGGASAGAIAASVTAAAEHGRYAEQPESVPEDSVRPGFPGLAGLVDWMISGTGHARWRMAQLFQPNADKRVRRMFRVVMAAMQKPDTTGRKQSSALIPALLGAVSWPARAMLAVLLVAWLAGPLAQTLWLVQPDRWDGWPVAIVGGVLALFAGSWTIRLAAARIRLATLALVVPLILGAGALVGWGLAHEASPPEWIAASAAVVLGWLALTFAVLAAFAAIYGEATWRLLTHTKEFRFGLVPGAAPHRAGWRDRLSGMPRSTGVPPLATWLADRIDELAAKQGRALTFGDLWRGSKTEADFPALAKDAQLRVVNLKLMTTDLTAGRPFQLPFAPSVDDEDRWQFCEKCLTGIVPERIVAQLKETGAAGVSCELHEDVTLHWLPEPWDLPVVLATRMSLSLPGLICAVPLHRQGKAHWFSDGGIASNFPIHFFDSLLPRWPTFGLTLDSRDGTIADGDKVFLPKQDASRSGEPWIEVGDGFIAFASRILDTFLGWRDVMQSALPGFRGRIVHVRQGQGEGGTNLFMPPQVIAGLALRGYQAGEELKRRFAQEPCDGEADGFTQTDRYRWIRMRLALREYRELARQARTRAPLYSECAAKYEIPEELSGWFADGSGGWPRKEPYATSIEAVFVKLSALADTDLAEAFDGTSPVNPVFRLTPPE